MCTFLHPVNAVNRSFGRKALVSPLDHAETVAKLISKRSSWVELFKAAVSARPSMHMWVSTTVGTL